MNEIDISGNFPNEMKKTNSFVCLNFNKKNLSLLIFGQTSIIIEANECVCMSFISEK